jgi:hypothetical protein
MPCSEVRRARGFLDPWLLGSLASDPSRTFPYLRWRVAAELEGTYLLFRSANYDAWETNDFFPSDGWVAECSLALYEYLSAGKSKGRNSAASGTNVSLRLPIRVNATVSISSLPSLLKILSPGIIRRLAVIYSCYFLWPITKADV